VNVRVLETVEDQEEGLQHLNLIPSDTLYVFPVVPEGTEFHSMNVPEPFDIAFLTEDYFVLTLARMVPHKDRIKAPKASSMAVEAKAGNLARWGFYPGNTMTPIAE
jgi:uncharacterized membrane protein (UPF0127 family)